MGFEYCSQKGVRRVVFWLSPVAYRAQADT
jgi:hypothetical protein